VIRRRRDNEAALYDLDPAARLTAARGTSPRETERLKRGGAGWPPFSPGVVNAWLLLVTTKPPGWRDPLLEWPEQPLMVGAVHEGFLYPDPVGFWTEVRSWATTVVRTRVSDWTVTEALGVSALVHLGGDPDTAVTRLALARATCRPHVLLFLDEPSWAAAALDPVETELHPIPDPHRVGQVYQGLWGRLADGTIVGKAPQHPAMHQLYESAGMGHFLAAVPPD
jgi:hypothetical protein